MTNIIRQFLRLESAGGILLILAAILAIIFANSPFSTLYHSFLDIPVAFQFSALDIRKPLLLWVNDGLMAVFFLLIGLEVKRELLVGSLAGRSQAIFPLIAAIGGMLIPATIYLFFTIGDKVALQGWAIPTATDIAFALGVMALLGKRVPTNLKIFLLALAIIDDLGAIIIIACFYTNQLSFTALVVAFSTILGLIYLNYKNIGRLFPYLLLGIILWVSVLKSGVHATLAGVIVGLVIPLRAKNNVQPSKHLEHILHSWVAYLILPLFAFANAGVSMSGFSFADLTSAVPMGVILGLFVGKPLGIFLFSYVGVKLNVARLPENIMMKHILAVSILCGIGFTMSIFISSLAFSEYARELNNHARMAILIGSTIAALVGYAVLSMTLRSQHKR